MKRFVLFVALAAIASGAAAPSAQRTAVVPPGVSIGGVSLGGLSSEEARNAVSWWYNRPLRFVFYGKHWSVRPAALGATVDADAADLDARGDDLHALGTRGGGSGSDRGQHNKKHEPLHVQEFRPSAGRPVGSPP